ncbi:MAG: c-type cytochrome [Actinomycetia bacterium]|nr:c-type cytochrome [Actinomycetes bacterium]
MILLDGVRARLLLAGAAAAALIGVVAVVFVAAAPEESAMPSEPLRRSPAPAPAGILAPPSVPTGDTRAGAEVFVAAGFGNCHTLLAAGATGTIAPALDGRTPSYERFLAQVTEGGFGMPAYRGQLTETEIEDVVAFVLDAIAPP